MSASKRAYEGPDPAQLLLEVWSNHGSDARISEPERVRKGGVLGFFATSVYRVEVDEEQSVPQVVRQSPAVDDAPSTRLSAPMTTPQMNHERFAPMFSPPRKSTVSAGLAGLIEDTDDFFERTPVEDRSFDAVLEEVAGSLGTEPSAFTPPPFADAVADPAPAANLLDPERFDSIDDLVRRAVHKTVEEDVALGLSVPPHLADPIAPAPTAPEIDEPLPMAAHVDEPIALERALIDVAAPSPLAAEYGRFLTLLEEVGYPTTLLEPLVGTSLFPASIEDAFALLGPAPAMPKLIGSLLAVAAPVGEALPLARALATAHKLDPAKVALFTAPKSPTLLRPAFDPSARRRVDGIAKCRPASGFCATDIQGARALSNGWRRDRVGIVAVEVGERPTKALRTALRTLSPTAVWMAADARAKDEDLLALANALGGVDALVLHHAARTTTPASALRTGMPVAMIDGKRADVARWTGLVARATREE